MKTYNDLITNEEEIDGEYQDTECPSCDTMEQPNGEEAPTTTFTIGNEYKTKIENSLSKLEGAMSTALEAEIRFKTENCDNGIKLIANVTDAIKANIFKSLSIESQCASDFEKEPNTGHSITKFFFKAIIEAEDGSEVEVNIPSNEYWFDFDLNDWMVIKK